VLYEGRPALSFHCLSHRYSLHRAGCSNPDTPTVACTIPPAQSRLVDVEGHKISYKVAGSGSPTLVLEYGLGGSSANWDSIFPTVARFTPVVSYDRAGYGKSEPGPAPRSQERLAKELHTLLHNAGIMPPYVLVGHSLGGANIRAFADQNPTRNFDNTLAENPPVRVYDSSGPCGDPAIDCDVRDGLPARRRDWIIARDDVEEYEGRELPIDDGYLTFDAANQARQKEKGRLEDFPALHRTPLRAKPGRCVTQMHYAKQGIITPEMEYIA
jgi:pimeloyl-ACP methyl ester carboxylesterase